MQVSKSLYNETYLQYCRWAAGDADDSYFVAARCRAQMKNGVTYLVNIQLDAIGAVLAAECECAAGMGPDAHCKHVAAVLYGLSVYQKEGELKTERTCTQKLQQFHATKKPHGGSPVKAANLSLPFGGDIVGDPRPPQFRNRAGYNAFFLNTWKACPGVSRRPVSHLFEPANMHGIVNDHNYCDTDYETDCLRNLGVHELTEKGRDDIERSTRGQASNAKWAAERTKRLHSSNFGRICKMTERTDARNFAEQLTQHSKLSTKPIQHGKRYEPEAVRLFSQCQKKEVSDCGIFVSADHPFLAASPDGVIKESDGEMAVLEVKCPYSVKDKLISAETVPYLVETKSSLTLKENHDYYYQVQGQMLCTKAKKAYFVVYTFKDLVVIPIPRNEAFIEDMVRKLSAFFNSDFRHVLLETHLYRTYRGEEEMESN